MRKIYTAANLIEAKTLARILDQQGLLNFVKNENLQVGLGELPFVEVWPEVWLVSEEDWKDADEILQQFLRQEKLSDWKCTWCSETNPGAFELCWSCGAFEASKCS